MRWWHEPRTRRLVLSLALVVVIINLPLLHSTWTNWRVERSGVEVTTTVVDADDLGTAAEPRLWVSWRFDERIDPDQVEWAAEVDAATYERARETGRLTVRVLPDEPAAHQAVGEVRRNLGLLTTLVADGVLAVVIWLLWRFRGRGGRDQVGVQAVTDVELARPGAEWLDLEDGTVMVRGEVLEKDDDEVLLDLGDQLVRVVLEGHTCRVGHQQPAHVRVRPL